MTIMCKEQEKGEGTTIKTVIKNGRSTLSLTYNDFGDDDNGIESPVQTTTTTTTNYSSSSLLPEGKKNLALMMLGCESNPPYGPNEKVATLFLQLMSCAIKKQQQQSPLSSSSTVSLSSSITITIYNAEKNEYPQNEAEWDLYDGILIPGSHSSAYDDDRGVEWIGKLNGVIRRYIHEKRRKTLGVCFGHQVLAHALSSSSSSRGKNEIGGDDDKGETTATDGLAVPCPSGSQWGRKGSILTDEGKELLSSLFLQRDDEAATTEDIMTEEEEQQQQQQRKERKNDDDEDDDGLLHLLYTHGDMVQRLPPFAVTLSGTDIVPIQSAAYFRSVEEAASFREMSRRHCRISNNETTTTTTTTTCSSHRPRPYAISFQSHPEYASEMGFNETFPSVLNKPTGGCSKDDAFLAMEDAVMHFHLVRRHSVEVMMVVGREFGWW